MRLLLFLLAVPLCAEPIDSAQARAYLVRWEGCRLIPYKDGRAITVGIGHNLTAHRERVKSRYTQDEVADFFDRDLAAARRAARAGVRDFDDLPGPVQEVVLGLIWTVGPTGFQRFVNLRFALSHRMFSAAATELGLSRWFTQVSAERANHSLRVLRNS